MVNKQTFQNFINQDIEIVRGDTLAFNIQIAGLEAADHPVIDMMCRENYNGDVIFDSNTTGGIDLVSDVNGVRTYAVRVDPTQTEEAEIGRYEYALRLMLNGDVLTLMRGYFTLLNNID